ncbi:hypothetical protein AALO_G00179580 [Alosa alosa]|uniref:Uncharacterized protein n=1 Tax=Alosa alosa TaxID=278164 RepID=A0AAV6GD47_9TELE|nr:hypothetical protein AALO_G00179580 [Alosa alosa]
MMCSSEIWCKANANRINKLAVELTAVDKSFSVVLFMWVTAEIHLHSCTGCLFGWQSGWLFHYGLGLAQGFSPVLNTGACLIVFP